MSEKCDIVVLGGKHDNPSECATAGGTATWREEMTKARNAGGPR